MLCNPTEKFFEVFKTGCKILFLWPDYGRSWTLNSTARFDRFIDLNVAIACEKTIEDKKIFWAWTPEDPLLFYFDGSFDNKDLDLVFLGTIHSPERSEYINFLKLNLPKDFKTYFGGGQRNKRLSAEKYGEITRRAKIVINFPFSIVGNDQVKGRVFESTSCGSLLLERSNNRTKEFFTPGLEYVEYFTKEDLLKNIKFYLKPENDSLRKDIAMNGFKRFQKDWSHNKFWESLFDRINLI